MRIVNNTARIVTLTFRDGRTPTVPASSYITLDDSDTDYLDDTQATLNLFSTGVLTLQNTDGSAWSGTPLPSTPSQGLTPGQVPVLVDQNNVLKRSDNGATIPGTGGAGTTTNALTVNASGTGAAPGSTFNGSAARTISYNSVGAAPAGAGASGAITKADVGLGNVDNPSDGSTLGSTYTAADADSGQMKQTPVACAVTIDAGRKIGWNTGFSGAGAVSFVAGTGAPTITDKRTSGAANPVCCAYRVSATAYEIIGVKA